MNRLITTLVTIISVLSLALPSEAAFIFQDRTFGVVQGTRGTDFIFLGHGPGRGIGCGGDDLVSAGNDDFDNPMQDRLYGDKGPDGQCPNAKGHDNIHMGTVDIGFGGGCPDDGQPVCDIYVLHGMNYPDFVWVDGMLLPGYARIDQFNMKDRVTVARSATLYVVDTRNFPYRPNEQLSDGRIREQVTALELRTPELGAVEGSKVWVLVKFITSDPPRITYLPGHRQEALDDLLERIVL